MAKSTKFFKEICKYSREDFDKILLEKGKHGKLPKVFFHLTDEEKEKYRQSIKNSAISELKVIWYKTYL